MVHKVFVLAALVAVASAEIFPTYSTPGPSYNHPTPDYHAPQHVGPAQYAFNWNVEDDYAGNNYGHEESRDGYDTKGSYYVHLPDGRLQRVTYVVNGDSGLLAQVHYEGDAHYPASPTYQSTPTYQPVPTYN